MSLGKRARHPMRRTTSISGISNDLNLGDEPWQDSDFQDNSGYRYPMLFGGGVIGVASQRAVHRSQSSECSDAAHFLRTCCLCKRRLFPGRDIYMYRGDSAFCSLECRQQQMNLDEMKEKCSLASKKESSSSSSSTSSSAAACASSNPETIATVV